MHSIRCVSLPFRRRLALSSRCLPIAFRVPYRLRHGDHAVTAPIAAFDGAPPPKSSHEDLFPTEFSEYINYPEPERPARPSDQQADDVIKKQSSKQSSYLLEKDEPLKVGHGQPLLPPPKTVWQMLSKFLPSYERKKVDLSYGHSGKREANLTGAITTFPAPAWWEGTDPQAQRDEPSIISFRNNTGLRKLLTDYLGDVEPLFDDSVEETTVLLALQSTFRDDSLHLLKKVGNNVTDVVSWAWIFSSRTVDLAFSRYAVLAEETRGSGITRVPKFVPLQLLRAEHVSAYALKKLIESILADLQLCLDAKEYHGWNWVTRVTLTVRLLRHARKVAPECLGNVAIIVKHLFSDYYRVHSRALEPAETHRLSLIFNRFLSLISLVPTKTPFNAYLLQQDAQLALLRLMYGFQPQVPVLREGYRALIAVQLLHRKTRHERSWAEAKSLSWPPWRKIKSGIEEDLEFPGKDSRVIKLLRRMQEAGYTLGDWEKSAAILAGWDTDLSPTIQTRAILALPRRPWLLSSARSAEDSTKRTDDTPLVWASRIRATRTAREAWASFCSYESSLENSRAEYPPYYAMLDKLLATTVKLGSTLEWKHLAGDLKEVFEVSTNPREQIYVEIEVPSVEEFYQRMLQAGIKPGGSVLASLLKHSSSSEVGFKYIQDSRWDEVTKDVLQHAAKYPRAIIVSSLQRIPIPTLAAFISLLSRSKSGAPNTFHNVGPFDEITGELRHKADEKVSATTYASQLLSAARVSDIRAWNGILEGTSLVIAKHVSSSRVLERAWSRRLEKSLWPKDYFAHAHPDLDTFHFTANILEVMLRYVDTDGLQIKIGKHAKRVFVAAVYGRLLPAFFPNMRNFLVVTPRTEDLMLLIRVLVSIEDGRGLVALVHWLNDHASKFQSSESLNASNEYTNGEGDVCTVRTVLCVVRGLFDPDVDWHAETVQTESPTKLHLLFQNSPTLLKQAEDHCQVLPWPSAEECSHVFARDSVWVSKIQRTVEKVVRRRTYRNMNRQAVVLIPADVEPGNDVDNSNEQPN